MVANSGNRVRQNYWPLAIGMGAVYLAAGIGLPLTDAVDADFRQMYLFGVSQLELFLSHPGWGFGLVVITALLFTIVPERNPSAVAFTDAWRRWLPLILAGLLSAGMFFLLRNNFINADGMAFAEKFARDIPLTGAHVTHDEMWELYVHSRFWDWTSGLFGWSVEQSYQVLSALAGGVFVVLLFLYARRAAPRTPMAFMVIMVCGGYMQLFFGDVENYTLTSVLIFAYFLAAQRHLGKGNTVIVPALLLGIAITFHLLAVALLPSLLYLLLRRWKAGYQRDVLQAVAILGGIVGGTLLWFHFNGLHLRDLWFYSHALGHGGDIIGMLAPCSPRYYFQLLNLLLLLMPAVLLLLPDLRSVFRATDALHVHLLVAAIGMGLYVLMWRAKLGVYEDWNLFAPAAVPSMLLVTRYICLDGKDLLRSTSVRVVAALSFLHSCSWIIGNHLR